MSDEQFNQLMGRLGNIKNLLVAILIQTMATTIILAISSHR